MALPTSLSGLLASRAVKKLILSFIDQPAMVMCYVSAPGTEYGLPLPASAHIALSLPRPVCGSSPTPQVLPCKVEPSPPLGQIPQASPLTSENTTGPLIHARAALLLGQALPQCQPHEVPQDARATTLPSDLSSVTSQRCHLRQTPLPPLRSSST